MTRTPSELALSLVVDRAVSEHVRVRCWKRPRPRPIAGQPAAHDGVEIAWVRRGRVHYRIGNDDLELGAGDVIVVPRFVEHTTAFVDDVEAGATWLSRDFVDHVLDACGSAARDLTPGVLVDGARFATLGAELEADAVADGPGQLLAVESIAEALVARLARRVASTAAQRGAGERRIRAAIDLIEARYESPLAVEALAKAAGMSRFHFSRAFREATGRAPYAYLIDVRLRRAAELLRAGHHTVTEAAFAVGFSDLGRFARAFRAKHACAPRDMARARRRTMTSG